MSKKDLDEATFIMKRPIKPGFKAGQPQYCSEEIPQEEQGESICFDTKGKTTSSETKCAAKKVITTKGTRYFIKWCMEGPDKGHLLNPYSIYYRDGDDCKLEQRRGKLRYEFKQVSEASFLSYVTFLNTKMYKYCSTAEMEILNG